MKIQFYKPQTLTLPTHTLYLHHDLYEATHEGKVQEKSEQKTINDPDAASQQQQSAKETSNFHHLLWRYGFG